MSFICINNRQEIMEEKKDIEQMLKNGTPVGFKPQGNSMHPTIVAGRDSVVVEPIGDRKLKRGDVVLFRRNSDAEVLPGALILHRICRVKKDGIYMVGDNEKQVEGPILPSRVIGIMTELIRKGKCIRTDGFLYTILTRIWLFLRPVRFVITAPKKACRYLKKML